MTDTIHAYTKGTKKPSYTRDTNEMQNTLQNSLQTSRNIPHLGYQDMGICKHLENL